MARGFVAYQWSLNFLSVVRGRAKNGREERSHAEEREKIVSHILYLWLDASTLIGSGGGFHARSRMPLSLLTQRKIRVHLYCSLKPASKLSFY